MKKLSNQLFNVLETASKTLHWGLIKNKTINLSCDHGKKLFEYYMPTVMMLLMKYL
ncbi:hypothetical protein ISS85_01165 [Candidatus Microgenomates bacterium]|nr:hypothetical protein [Candidatus Microgenomates bacterium]